MSSILNGTAKVVHATKLPESTTRAQAVAMLHDHEFFLECNPHMAKFEKIQPKTAPVVPDTLQDKIGTESASYTVTDVVHTLPAGLWDSNVVSTYEFTDVRDGVFVRIRSPLSVVLDTLWTIREAEGSRLELVENVTMSCSRVLLGVVKSTCENGWAAIHAKMISRLVEPAN